THRSRRLSNRRHNDLSTRFVRTFNESLLMKTLTLAVAAVFLSGGAIYGQTKLGTIVGLIKDPVNSPVAGATVVAARQDGGAIRSTVSNSDGMYSFADLAPGIYVVRSKMQSYSDVETAPLQVVAGDATRADMSMTLVPPPPTVSSAIPPAAAPVRRPQPPD